MPTVGVTPTPRRPGSTSQTSQCLLPAPARSAWVVQRWPDGGTHCRSSAQITQDGGGSAVSGECLPQVAQIQVGMGLLYLKSSGTNARGSTSTSQLPVLSRITASTPYGRSDGSCKNVTPLALSS